MQASGGVGYGLEGTNSSICFSCTMRRVRGLMLYEISPVGKSLYQFEHPLYVDTANSFLLKRNTLFARIILTIQCLSNVYTATKKSYTLDPYHGLHNRNGNLHNFKLMH